MNNKEISNELLKGIQYVVKEEIKKASIDKTTTGIVKNIKENNLYDVLIGNVTYTDIPSIFNGLKINDTIKIKIPQNQYSQMYIEGKYNLINTNDLFNLDKVYPIGSIYLSVNSVNPGDIFGGSWVEFGKGKTLIGVDSSDTDFNTVEKTGGKKTHALTTDEMPTHTHTPTVSGRPIGANDGSTPAWHMEAASDWRTADVISSTTSAGGGQPHNNMPPYITCYMWKRIS